MPDQISIHVAQTAKSCTDPAVICWMESHPGLASWAQFVGSMLAIMIALFAAWLPRYFDKIDRRSRALRAKPLLSEAMSAVRNDALQILRCLASSPDEIKTIELGSTIAKFEKVAWADLNDRDHTIGMFAYQHAQKLANERDRIEQSIEAGRDIIPLAKIISAQYDFLHALSMTFMEE